MEKTLQQIYYSGIQLLQNANIDNANYEARLLLEDTLDIDKTQILVYPNTEVSEEDYINYLNKINRRVNKEPIAYIIGYQEFMGLNFKVNPYVLIPRQDTETLIETVLEVCKTKVNPALLDICTGSGCIAISLGVFMKLNTIKGIDISEEALGIAKENAKYHNVKVEFLQSDLLQKLDMDEKFDIIVSNPPYIPTKDINDLMEDVKNFEPELALDGKEDGLYFYRIIAEESRNYLKDKGFLFFEIGYDQGKDVLGILENKGYKNIKVIKDLAGLDRVVYGEIAL
ncbi:release factor glutamine methyltransferase [Natranaerovirga pectinivora]|uniref:Release factor glutamine methyltransferase n=1 Tax=Natranaerovirga pectinivora TaxID=682400 RepID=A0A4R3MKH0_9FIRM|nr:peptide chain release factor N(5)-glutamine methyltransferase [Natranaerovirga pectinivora]TCT14321.1 release factor glutamine methyltransferase [Natranaerovirga pectinivora]